MNNEVTERLELSRNLDELMLFLDLFRSWRKASVINERPHSKDEVLILEAVHLCRALTPKDVTKLLGKGYPQVMLALRKLEKHKLIRLVKNATNRSQTIELTDNAQAMTNTIRSTATHCAGRMLADSRSLASPTPLGDSVADMNAAVTALKILLTAVFYEEVF